MADAELVREISDHVDRAIRENRRIETVLIIVLLCLVSTGLALLVLGAMDNKLTMTIPGALCELAIAMPIRSLVRLREENIRLAVLPIMLRLADPRSEKRMVVKYLEALISKVGS